MKEEKETKNYDPKNDLGAMVRFLNAVIDKNNTLIHQIDTQCSILISIGTAVFLFSANRFVAERHEYTLVIAIMSGLSVIAGLFALHPPKFMRKKGQKESMMYRKKIINYGDPLEYAKALETVIGDRDRMIEQYATELYNLATFYYQPKRLLFKISRNLLLAGIFLGLLVFILFTLN